MTHQMPLFSSLVLSSQYGGGVYVSGDGATVTFNDCQITSNTATIVSKQASPLVQCRCLVLVSDWSTQCRAVAKWGQFATSALRVLDQNEAPLHKE